MIGPKRYRVDRARAVADSSSTSARQSALVEFLGAVDPPRPAIDPGYLRSMNRASIRTWAAESQGAINLLAGTMGLVSNDAVLDDISVLGQVGNHLIDLADFVGQRVAPPTDAVQLLHWEQLIATTHALGIEITEAATLTFDLTSVASFAHQIAGR